MKITCAEQGVPGCRAVSLARSCASRRRDVASGVKGFKLQGDKGLKEVLGGFRGLEFWVGFRVKVKGLRLNLGVSLFGALSGFEMFCCTTWRFMGSYKWG